MGKLKEKMIQELDIRNRDHKTKKSYLYSMKLFVEYFGKSPDQLGIEDIKKFQQYLFVEKKYAPNTVNNITCGIRFFFVNVLGRAEYSKQIIKVRAPKKVPVILSENEVIRLIDSINSVLYKAVLMTFYSTGLRNEELREIKMADIDRERMVINVRKGKGKKERQALLSPTLLKVLESYWRLFRAKNNVKSDWLFMPTKNVYLGEIKRKLSHTAPGHFIDKAVEAAGIKKKLLLIL